MVNKEQAASAAVDLLPLLSAEKLLGSSMPGSIENVAVLLHYGLRDEKVNTELLGEANRTLVDNTKWVSLWGNVSKVEHMLSEQGLTLTAQEMEIFDTGYMRLVKGVEPTAIQMSLMKEVNGINTKHSEIRGRIGIDQNHRISTDVVPIEGESLLIRELVGDLDRGRLLSLELLKIRYMLNGSDHDLPKDLQEKLKSVESSSLELNRQIADVPKLFIDKGVIVTANDKRLWVDTMSELFMKDVLENIDLYGSQPQSSLEHSHTKLCNLFLKKCGKTIDSFEKGLLAMRIDGAKVHLQSLDNETLNRLTLATDPDLQALGQRIAGEDPDNTLKEIQNAQLRRAESAKEAHRLGNEARVQFTVTFRDESSQYIVESLLKALMSKLRLEGENLGGEMTDYAEAISKLEEAAEEPRFFDEEDDQIEDAPLSMATLSEELNAEAKKGYKSTLNLSMYFSTRDN